MSRYWQLWKIITSCFNLFKELTTIPLSYIKQNGNGSLKKYTSKMKLMQLQVKGKENSISITGCYLHFLQVNFYCGISHRWPTAPTHWVFVGATQLTRSWVLQSTKIQILGPLKPGLGNKLPLPHHNTRRTTPHPSLNMRHPRPPTHLSPIPIGECPTKMLSPECG